jgi:hypothetical protein
MRERGGLFADLVGKPEGKRPLGRRRHRSEVSIKIDLMEVGWGRGVDWSGLGQGQVAGTCKGVNELAGSIKWGFF